MKDPDLHLIHTYNRSITFVKGEDVYLYDNTGKNILIWEPALLCLPLATAMRSSNKG